jgi:general secretion pathway protein H
MRQNERGFTLIEMLVVVAMLAILSVSVVLSLRSSNSSALHTEAERLRSLLLLALDESRVTGSPIVWTATQDSYRFAAAGGNEDTGFADVLIDERLRSRRLENEVRIAMVKNDAHSSDSGGKVVLKGMAPPPFSISLHDGSSSLLIEGSTIGTIGIREPGDTR